MLARSRKLEAVLAVVISWSFQKESLQQVEMATIQNFPLQQVSQSNAGPYNGRLVTSISSQCVLARSRKLVCVSVTDSIDFKMNEEQV